MANLLLEFPAGHPEILDTLRSSLGDQLTVVEPDHFDGTTLIHVLVPLIGPTIGALTTVLTTHFKNRPSGSRDRKVIYDGRVIYLEGYSEQEITNILEKLRSGG
jgi:hypothetical protein